MENNARIAHGLQHVAEQRKIRQAELAKPMRRNLLQRVYARLALRLGGEEPLPLQRLGVRLAMLLQPLLCHPLLLR